MPQTPLLFIKPGTIIRYIPSGYKRAITVRVNKVSLCTGAYHAIKFDGNRVLASDPTAIRGYWADLVKYSYATVEVIR